MAWYYSASERAFFSSELMSVDAMPADKVAVEDQTYNQLMADQVAGKLIRTGAGGMPESVEQALEPASHFGDAEFENVKAAEVEIEGGVTVGGDGSVNGSWSADELSVSGAVEVGDNLTVDGEVTTVKLSATSATISGDLSAAGNTTISATGLSTSKVTATALALNGNAEISGTMSVTGAATVQGALNAQGGLNVTTIHATGDSTFGAVNASNLSASGTLSVNGATTLTGKLTANGGVATTDLSAASLGLTGNANVSGTLTVGGESSFKKITTTEIDLNGNADISGTLTVTGAADLKGGATIPMPAQDCPDQTVVCAGWFKEFAGSSVPTGMIAYFALTAVPEGWLICNGSNVSRVTYAALFAAIGERFGAGNGVDTFTLPNLEARFIEGTTDVSKVGQYIEAGLPNITGSLGITGNDPSHAFSVSYTEGCFTTTETSLSGLDSGSSGYRTGIPKFDSSLSSSLFGTSQTVQPSSMQMLICIKI